MTYEESLSRHERWILDLDKAALQHEKEIKDIRVSLAQIALQLDQIAGALNKVCHSIGTIG